MSLRRLPRAFWSGWTRQAQRRWSIRRVRLTRWPKCSNAMVERLLAMTHTERLGLPWHAEGWQAGSAIMRRIADVWQHPDDGIWEVRGGRQQFVYSKVMVWVAVDRMVRIIEEFGAGSEEDRAALPRLRALREQGACAFARRV